MTLSASIIICTYNRHELLAEALASLAVQTASDDSFEIIVVDNNSTDRTRAVVEDAAAGQSNVRYIMEPEPGLSAARDAGYMSARSDWVVYLDDDIKAAPNLVERFQEVIEAHAFDCVGGLCLPWYRYGRPRWLHDRYVINEVDPGIGTGELKSEYAKGAMIAFRKSILEELGGFREPHGRSLGMHQRTLAYGEETRIQVEMRKRGYVIGFDRELQVEHLVHKDRLHAGFFIRMRFAKGRDYWDTFGLTPTWPLILRRAPFVFMKPLARLPRALARLVTQREYRPTNLWLDVMYPAATLVGQMHGGVRIRMSRKAPEAP